MSEDFLSKMMDFDPSNLSAFQEPVQTSANDDPEIYKTNPVKLSVSEDGHYHAKIRILYNPFHIEESVVKRVLYAMRDSEGFFTAPSSLSKGDKKCPLFTAWKKLHYAKHPDGSDNVEVQQWGDKMYDKTETRWVLVQIIEDENQPDLVGKFRFWKLPKSIWTKLDAKMHPSPESKKAPVSVMDYLFGPIMTLNVTPGPEDKAAPERREREISYDLCEFEKDPFPIVSLDGSQLFTDDDLEVIERYNDAKEIISSASFKKVSEKKLNEAKTEITELKTAIRDLYSKAIDFMKENGLNPEEKFSFKPWSPELRERVEKWIEKVANMQDPAIQAWAAPGTATADTKAPLEYPEYPTDPVDDVFKEAMGEEEDLPF